MRIAFASLVVIVSFYSFGTFGLLNLFNARSAVQAVTFVLMTLTIATFYLQIKLKRFPLYLLIIFFALYGMGMVVSTGNLTVILETWVMLCLAFIIMFSPQYFAVRMAKLIVITTFILCIFIVAAYSYYLAYPESFARANFNIYDSTTGSAMITVGHFIDYFSFTSGDGFQIGGMSFPRLKGYSNEPSATIVHYLAPVALSFILGGRYILLGGFILAVNMVAISSFLAYLIIASTPLLYSAFSIFKKRILVAVYVGVAIFFVLLTKIDILVSLQQEVAAEVFNLLDYDLLLRKQGSLETRLFGFSTDVETLISSPLGGGGNSASGLMFSIGSSAGWIGLLIYLVWVTNLLKVMEMYFKNNVLLGAKLGMCLAASIVVFATIVSGYGWDRVPGVVILLLFFRLLGGLDDTATHNVLKFTFGVNSRV